MEKRITKETKERIEAVEGMDVSDAAKLRYLEEFRSFRWLASHWGVNGRTVGRVLHCCGIAVRHGSDAVSAQWVGAAERRVRAGETLANINHSLAQQGRHVRQGKTAANSELVRGVAAKLRTSSSFFRDDVKRRAVAASLATRALHPERMSALKAPLSLAESKIRDYLAARSLPFEQRKLVGKYVVDFYIPSIGLVVDCQGRNRFPLSPERHRRILEEGCRVAYCVNDFVERGVFRRLDDYITLLEQSGLDPASRCAESVVFGACGAFPFGKDCHDIACHRFGVRTDYYTEVSASPDY